MRYRQSRHWWFPHFVWLSPGPPQHPSTKRGEIFEYIPAQYVDARRKLILPPPGGVWYVHRVQPQDLYLALSAPAWV